MEQFEASSELLYGLIHARYILTSKGLDAMKAKLQRAEFGRCPRVLCAGQPCLPVGQVCTLNAVETCACVIRRPTHQVLILSKYSVHAVKIYTILVVHVMVI